MLASILRIPVALLLCCGALSLSPGAFARAGALFEVGPDRTVEPRPPMPAEEDAVPDGLSTDDWTSIREAYEAGRHAAHPVEGGLQARNPGQQWRTVFDGLGFLIEPDARGWTWGLKLERYGFAGREQEVGQPVGVRSEGGRVAYEWNETLEEWYVNDTRGLEHGYTVHRRPTLNGHDQGGPLIFTLAVRGELRPEVTADGRGVRFLGGEGVLALTYTGLSVVDANGKELEASFELIGEGMRLLVNERDARYPLTIDPIVQMAYLKASNTDAVDRFGQSVAVSGDTVVVGAIGEDSNATGVNGDQGDNSASGSGAAYVFVRSGTVWTQEAYLKASNTDEGDSFGSSVAVTGDTIVVGAHCEASNATGVNDDQTDNSAPDSGAAYVFVRSGTSWSQEAYLKASNTDPGDEFGSSLAASGNMIVVGAYREDSFATGVNGVQMSNSEPDSGAAYVFVRSGTSWSQEAYLKASNTDPADEFGVSVATTGDTIVVGAWHEAGSATGVNGNHDYDNCPRSGAAFVFVRNGTTWSQQAYLKASNTGREDNFGHRVAESGETIVVGAPGEDSNATGVDGDQGDNSADAAGAAYVFVRSGTTWSQQAYLKASNTDAEDLFGSSVAVSGDTVVVGASDEASRATGVDGDQSDNNADASGAAYVFLRTRMHWDQQAYLKASNTGWRDQFGHSVALSGSTVVVGARGESSPSTGVNGGQNDDTASRAGAAYVIDLDPPPATCQWYCGTGVNAATDGYVIISPAVLGGTFWASVTGCASGNAGAVLAAYSTPLTLLSAWGEILVNLADPNGELLGMPTGVGYPVVFTLPVPNDAQLFGFLFYTQAASFGSGGSLCLHCAHACTVGF